MSAITLTTAPALADTRLARIMAKGALRVCIWPDNGLMTWRDPRSGNVTGLDAEMAQAFARELGVALAYVDSATMGALPAALGENRCDVAMSGLVVNRDREALVRFSRPYLRHAMVAVTVRHSKRIRAWSDLDQPRVVIGLSPGTASEDAARRYLRRATLTFLNPPATRERALEAGRIDGFVTSYPLAAHFANRHEWARLIVPEQPSVVFDYAYGVKPDDDAWATRVDLFVAAIRADGRLARAAREHGLAAMLIERAS